jgi:hypothetical protein
MTIAGVKKKMSENPDDLKQNHEIIKRLTKVRAMLVEIRDA